MALKKIEFVTGTGVYVAGDDIDTDRIIPARYLRCITFDGLGEFAFIDERIDENGNERDHPLNDPRFHGASILLCGSNFGCGSSREHAPQSLYHHGFRAIVGVSFAEIFFGNSVKLGIPCLTASREEIESLAARIEVEPKLTISLNVADGRVSFGDYSFLGALPAGPRTSLIEGRWDPIAELLEGEEMVERVASTLAYVAGRGAQSGVRPVQ